MEFSRQEYWRELPFPSPGIVLTQRSNLSFLHCRQILYHLSHSALFIVLLLIYPAHPCPLQFSSVTQSCLALCNPVDCSMPDFPVYHQFLEPAQTHVHRVGDAIQPPHPLSSPSPLLFSLSQHQGLFQLVSSSYQVAKLLELQLQHQSFQ